ncbi:plastid division protein CDP1, chloroplastic-like isoform X2 [Aristolochia californica]
MMDLKHAEIDEGYTMDAVVSRQDLLMDVRDKLLFEPEFAGNVREKIPPKSSLRIPWAWLPAALCVLQEVGREKMVLEIGSAALQHSGAKPYVHDLLLSMALSECSIAKMGFEKNAVAQGFEALARAQYLLTGQASLQNMPLLSQIQTSLEELAPACTLERLRMSHTPENSDRRQGAIAALRELVRQGLEVETCCKVQDWPCFLSQALSKLNAAEIVDLLPWDNLVVTHKNKKSLVSQNQRIVIDFKCFYTAMLAHVAVGFSSRRKDLISKAKNICDCLVPSEVVNLKFEQAFCSFLLGQAGEAAVAESLPQHEVNGTAVSRNLESSSSNEKVNKSLEIWLKDEVLLTFPDTRDLSPSLIDFFRGEKRTLSVSKLSKGAAQIFPSVNHRASGEPSLNVNSTRNMGTAVRQLAPANLQNQFTVNKGSGSTPGPPVQLKRNLGSDRNKLWERCWDEAGITRRIALLTVVGCLFYATVKLLNMKFGQTLNSSYSSPKTSQLSTSSVTSAFVDPGCYNDPTQICRKNIGKKLGKLLLMFNKKNPKDEGMMQNTWPDDDLFSFSNVLNKRHMQLEEAETLVRQWQEIKADALGSDHQVQSLCEILSESMLTQWQVLAESARSRSCYWKFVLLSLSIVRAEVISYGKSGEKAEIEALLEEAAELVDESRTKNPNYYSTYKTWYLLKKQDDGSWRFCSGGILTPV